jgi:UDP:flavonoid glycosyltransferase YjiC (YdhE family)
MRVAVVAGPDPGHAFPAIALGLRFLANGDSPTVVTGTRWLGTAEDAGLGAMELRGLDVTEEDDDADAGEKINRRAARMAVLNSPQLEQLAPDLIVSDVITVAGAFTAELLGLPWVELNPQPLYRPSKGLPPIGSGLAPGTGVRGKIRDAVLRAMSARSWREGLRQRAAARTEIGLPATDPGPLRRLIATLPALEVPRPDWPSEAVIVGPLHFEPTSSTLAIPAGPGPVVVVAPSTAKTGARGLAELALDTLTPGEVLPEGARVVVSRLEGPDGPLPPWAAVGLGRQDELLSNADVVICGGGHGIVSKTMLAGVPLVVVPGGGDQWEISNRVVRQGSARLVRPLTAEALADAVRDVLSAPHYREAARRAGASLAGVDDPVRVCHEALADSA